jgi:hypothetical protein
MPIRFNTLLREAGFPLCDVRLVRHTGGPIRDRNRRTPYELWRDDRRAFDDYQSGHGRHNREKLNVPYWAVFVGTPHGKTLFVGIYALKGVEKGRAYDAYDLTLKPALADLRGRLLIDWAAGKRQSAAARAWVQYAEKHDKPVAELLRTEFADE